MKNLCFIIESMSGDGAVRVVRYLSHAVIKLGHHVHIVILANKIIYE